MDYHPGPITDLDHARCRVCSDFLRGGSCDIVTPIDVGILLGLLWASVLVVWTLAEITSGEPSPWVVMIACIYQGYDLSPRGILRGGLWAFADGFISGYVIWSIVGWFL